MKYQFSKYGILLKMISSNFTSVYWNVDALEIANFPCIASLLSATGYGLILISSKMDVHKDILFIHTGVRIERLHFTVNILILLKIPKQIRSNTCSFYSDVMLVWSKLIYSCSILFQKELSVLSQESLEILFRFCLGFVDPLLNLILIYLALPAYIYFIELLTKVIFTLECLPQPSHYTHCINCTTRKFCINLNIYTSLCSQGVSLEM